MPHKSALLFLALPALALLPLRAQPSDPQSVAAGIDKLMARLDRLESENQKLVEEIRLLRQELSAARIPERVDVLEHRSEEAEQTKVQASQRFPLAITGMALFNVFSNGKNGGGLQDPLAASLTPGTSVTGATFRQTVIGLRYDGPQALGAKLSGSVDLDLWGGDSTSLNHLLRLRTATLRMDWRDTTLTVGQDKPLISPRDPDSLAQVAFSPLTNAGNPWLWQPQARLEQRFSFGETSGVRLQGSLYQTREASTSTEAARPGWEGRAQYWRNFDRDRKIEIATGFHTSFSRAGNHAIPSDAVSFDWLVDPLPRFEITGAFYRGQNLAPIGGGLGITLLPTGVPVGVHQTSGWVQTSYRLTSRLKLNGFAGEQSDRAADLANAAQRRNLAWGGNFIYRLAPNVMASFEALQLRTAYLNAGLRINNHYDLALAYLF